MFRPLLIVLVLLVSDAALAQRAPRDAGPGLFQGTAAEQRACRRDSLKFCRDAVPDDFRVLACLQQHRQRISKACRRVLEKHGQ